MKIKLEDLKNEKYVSELTDEQIGLAVADLVEMLKADPNNNKIKDALKATVKEGCSRSNGNWEDEYAKLIKEVADTASPEVLPIWKKYIWIKSSLDYVGITLGSVAQIIGYTGGVLTTVLFQASQSFHEAVRNQGIKSREAREKKKDGDNDK